MNIIVLGAAGMLGHMTGRFLKKKYGTEVVLCARSKTPAAWLNESLYELDLADILALETLITFLRPCIVVNCAAVNDINKGSEKLDAINANLPKRIASILDSIKDDSRLIHISTDGVFSGSRGQYSEDDPPDAQDLYGKSKLAGEVTHAPHLTVRTSIIGPDPFKSYGLMNWFLSQTAAVKGFSTVFWSGVTTLELARFIDYAVERHVSGLIHLTSRKISKYEILVMMKDIFAKHIDIEKDEKVALDRSLISVRKDIDYKAPELRKMLTDIKSMMSAESELYGKLFENPK